MNIVKCHVEVEMQLQSSSAQAQAMFKDGRYLIQQEILRTFWELWELEQTYIVNVLFE